MPGLITFRATFAWIGRSCSATNTKPNPPRAICSNSLYGPIAMPTCSVMNSLAKVGGRLRVDFSGTLSAPFVRCQ